ncbi:MAG: hypothetical protein A4E45_01744 [Methanosaeta sp. PtaB.Bin039]|nr:MAG: hypothetical protein A4E45_01744 [Methanosaeta sp. PtaB.Bin039]HOT06952.1 hypothetical protein [Methanotrichaceae archaeon]HQF17162.1 hypothetical protein [Methanotrichaceae archaeon]HQI91562.1 hypothetical protein [Methanotrichaceae archaeon]
MEWAVVLLVLEGIPFLAWIYYLNHKKSMYLLERGLDEPSQSSLRAERRLLNGIFLLTAGAAMILTPLAAKSIGVEAQLSYELLLAGIIVICCGISLIIGSKIIKSRDEKDTSSKSFFDLR